MQMSRISDDSVESDEGHGVLVRIHVKVEWDIVVCCADRRNGKVERNSFDELFFSFRKVYRLLHGWVISTVLAEICGIQRTDRHRRCKARMSQKLWQGVLRGNSGLEGPLATRVSELLAVGKSITCSPVIFGATSNSDNEIDYSFQAGSV